MFKKVDKKVLRVQTDRVKQEYYRNEYFDQGCKCVDRRTVGIEESRA